MIHGAVTTTVEFDIADWKGPTATAAASSLLSIQPPNPTGKMTLRFISRSQCPLTRLPDSITIPPEYSAVTFHESMSSVTTIGHSFLSGCSNLRSVDLTELRNVKSVGDGFLKGCSGVTLLKMFNPFGGLATVGNCFLQDCTAITALDLSFLSDAAYIGDQCLCGCFGLLALDLTPMSRVTYIGDSFLSGCSGITTLDLGPIGGAANIGGNFLARCSGLTMLDLTPLTGVVGIGDSFLSGCSSLVSLNLSPLGGVMTIGRNFLAACAGLTTLDFRPLRNVASIGPQFLKGCPRLTSVAVVASTNDGIICGDKEHAILVLESQVLILSKLDHLEQGHHGETIDAAQVSSQPHRSSTSPWPCCLSDMVLVRNLGGGGQGTVSLFMDNKTQELVAVKCVPVSNNSKALSEEYTKLAKLNHPNIIRVFQFIEDTEMAGCRGRQDCIVMEYMSLGSTSSLVLRKQSETIIFPESGRWLDVARETLKGLQALHDNKMLHNDLKPDNILMVQEGGKIVYKLADLGLGAEVDDSPSASNILDGTVGTRCYIAPESIEERKYSSASDVYAWACTMGYIATGKPPKAYQQGRPEDHRGFTAKELQSIGTKIDVKIAEKLVSCFSFDRSARPKVKDLISYFLDIR